MPQDNTNQGSTGISALDNLLSSLNSNNTSPLPSAAPAQGSGLLNGLLQAGGQSINNSGNQNQTQLGQNLQIPMRNSITNLSDTQAKALQSVLQTQHKNDAQDFLNQVGTTQAENLLNAHNAISNNTNTNTNTSSKSSNTPSPASSTNNNSISSTPQLTNGQYNNQQQSDASNNILNQTNKTVTPQNIMQHPIAAMFNFLGNITGINAIDQGVKSIQLDNLIKAQKLTGTEQFQGSEQKKLDAETQQKIDQAINVPVSPTDKLNALTNLHKQAVDDTSQYVAQLQDLQKYRTGIGIATGNMPPKVLAAQKNLISSQYRTAKFADAIANQLGINMKSTTSTGQKNPGQDNIKGKLSGKLKSGVSYSVVNQ